jgi:hypothetical protein
MVMLVATVLAGGCRHADSGASETASQAGAQPDARAVRTLDAATAANAPVYMCPMDRDVRGHAPGKCPRCGMALVTSIPDPVEYRVELSTDTAPQPGVPVGLTFRITDPWKGNPVTRFTEVHERLYHAFVVSRDLQFFVHGHPEFRDGAFKYDVTFPSAGMYRVLSDFYPEAAVPQLAATTLFVGNVEPDARPVKLARDDSPKQGTNLTVSMVTIPQHPVTGIPTRVRFTLSPAAGLERYLGVWGHMLLASDDLIDMMHTHPSLADGGAEAEFSIVFPRAHTYRLWVQFQRNGEVNTVHFDLPVRPHPPHDTRITAMQLFPAWMGE